MSSRKRSAGGQPLLPTGHQTGSGTQSSKAALHISRVARLTVSFTDENARHSPLHPRGGRIWPGPPRQRWSQKKVLLLVLVQGLGGPQCLSNSPLACV